MTLKPPISYQGGKVRLAPAIVDILIKENSQHFYDLCCGSGAVSIEMVNRGHPPEHIWMVDKGPWGLVWELIGKGKFEFNTLDKYINRLPSNISDYKSFFEDLSTQDALIDTAYVFLLLQAASFGSKPIWFEGDAWKNCSFRSYWTPTETSNRKYAVNPMMPMPATLRKRLGELCKHMEGVNGSCDDIKYVTPIWDSTIYIDPPYQDRTAYGHTFSYEDLENLKGLKLFISEGFKMDDKSYLLASSKERKKGGISGNKKRESNEEWLNIIQLGCSDIG